MKSPPPRLAINGLDALAHALVEILEGPPLQEHVDGGNTTERGRQIHKKGDLMAALAFALAAGPGPELRLPFWLAIMRRFRTLGVVKSAVFTR